MKVTKLVVALLISGINMAFYCTSSIAQQVTGELGSPSATTLQSAENSCRRQIQSLVV